MTQSRNANTIARIFGEASVTGNGADYVEDLDMGMILFNPVLDENEGLYNIASKFNDILHAFMGVEIDLFAPTKDRPVLRIRLRHIGF